MSEKMEKKRLAVLRFLSEADGPQTSPAIAEHLTASGHEMSERTIRLYLMDLDEEELTQNHGKRGRTVTEKGLAELASARAFDKVGYLAAKIDRMMYRMTFNLREQAGTVVINLSIISKDMLATAVPLLSSVFQAGYSMGSLVALFGPGQRVGEVTIPASSIGIGTVCSVTVNGVLLSEGIPTASRFGGLLEVRSGKYTRFVELIHYEGTTLDPLEVFIRSRMTDYTGATATGNGRIGASFREVPAESRAAVLSIAERLEGVGLRGFISIGWPGQPLMEIPVGDGRIGIVVIGGLNPVAILEEKGIHVQFTGALAGLLDYGALYHYREMEDRAGKLLK
jgi:HTH-type transcriptional regulator, global nitrogen regulator NrpRI